MNLKQIILPSDFSDNAWKAMSYAADLYHNVPCKFHIINTYTYPITIPKVGGAVPIQALGNGSEEYLEILLKQFKDLDHHPLSEFESKSICGSLATSIEVYEDLLKEPVIIVMGTRGVTNIGELFFGTMTASIIKNVKSPVICVPNVAHLSIPKNIMLSIDEQGVANKEEIQPLFDLAENWKSSIAVVHVGSDKEIIAKESSERIGINNHLATIDHSFHAIPGDYIEDELTHFAKKNKMDLVALIKRDHGFLNNFFHTSLTKNLAFYSEIPLLILRESGN